MCAHEWPQQEIIEETIVRDANGNILSDGDSVTVIKDLKVKGSSSVIKQGTKVKNIKLVDPDNGHDIDCKIDGFGQMSLKSEFVKIMMKRIESIDIMRGISIMGILFMNIVGFHMNEVFTNPLDYFQLPLDRILYYFDILFVHNSFYPIFSFLFGFGLAIMATNIRQRGGEFYTSVI